MDTFEGVLPYLATIKHLKPQSVKKYTGLFRIISKWLDGRELTQDLIENFFSEQVERNKNTVNAYLSIWRHYVNYLDYKGITHPYKRIPFYKRQKRVINVLTPEEIDAILNVEIKTCNFRGQLTDHRNFVMMTIIRFLALTGCRLDECLSLKVKDVNLSKNECWFTETKTGVPRKAFIPSILAHRIELITLESKADDFVFQNTNRTRFKQNQVYTDLAKVAKMAGITKHVNPHLFRHSLATQLLQEGVDISIVARILGHANVQQTYSTYAHIADNSLREELIKHPIIRKDIDPAYLLEKIKDQVRKLRLHDDDRFVFKFTEGQHSLELLVAVK